MPDNYTDIHDGPRTARVLAVHQHEIAPALLHGTNCQPVHRGGRGPLGAFTCQQQPALIRPCRRGGILRNILPKTSFLTNRPLREFHLHQQAQQAGLPVPPLLGVLWTRRGPVYSGAIATAQLPGQTLHHFLEAAPGNATDPTPILHAAARAIRQMHDAGIWHADLNAHNLLVHENHVTILDFDKARRYPKLSNLRRAQNLLRLRRSLEKEGHGPHTFNEILAHYGEITIPKWLNRAFRLKAALSNALRPWTGPLHIETTPGVQGEDVRRALKATGHVIKTTAKWQTKSTGPWIVKTQRGLPPINVLRHLLHPARSRRAWDAARRLRDAGVHVPAPRAYAEERRLGLPIRAATIIDHLHHHPTIEEHARRLIREAAPPETIQAFLNTIAHEVVNLENARATHADLSGKNLLTTQSGSPVYLIDLDSIQLDTEYTPEKRLKNHVQLYDSFCDVIPDGLLQPFITAMLPPNIGPDPWFQRVKQGQHTRRTRQQKIWRHQGKPPTPNQTPENT